MVFSSLFFSPSFFSVLFASSPPPRAVKIMESTAVLKRGVGYEMSRLGHYLTQASKPSILPFPSTLINTHDKTPHLTHLGLHSLLPAQVLNQIETAVRRWPEPRLPVSFFFR